MEKNDNKSSNSSRKRPFFEDEYDEDTSNKQSSQKRVRFPKGKKVKTGGEEAAVAVAVGPVDKDDDESERIAFKAREAAKERAKRRVEKTAELLNDQSSGVHDISTAEVNYKENENIEDEGIQLEPFNLEKEREEGYFDADGNFVHYVSTNEEKDAWLDSVEVDPKLAEKCFSEAKIAAVEIPDLSSAEIGHIKRYIADLLEPEETVLQALRRMKGNPNNRKEKMSAEKKLSFDRLTECAMKLMEDGDYNVYHEKQEVFQREAEGYERLERAKGKGMPLSTTNGEASVVAEMTLGDGGDEAFDMFADDDDTAVAPSTGGNNFPLSLDSNTSGLSSAIPTTDSTNGALQNDYVFDESSGYYYSSSSGYYYDPSTGLYCYASSGQWYSYNEDTGTYDEFQEPATTQAAV